LVPFHGLFTALHQAQAETFLSLTGVQVYRPELAKSSKKPTERALFKPLG
jgi:hypothetical protein